MASGKRNYGIDLLRILAMLFVVLLHICSHGGALSAATGASVHAVNIVRSFAMCAVNAFVMISGFVMVESTFKSKRVISLWAEALFYSVMVSVAFLVWINPQLVTPTIMARSFIPVISNKWWFFTQYFVLFFFMPILNKGLMALNERQCLLVIASVFAVTCLILISGDIVKFDRGYSVGWFVLLYITGGAAKRASHLLRGRALVWLGAYIGVCLLTFACNYLVTKYAGSTGFLSDVGKRILTYSSPFVFASAFSILIFASKLHIEGNIPGKIIAFCSSSAFAVYLISDHVWIRNTFVKGSFTFVTELAPPVTIACMVGIAIAIFVVCMLIDKVRLALFKVLRIDNLIQRIGSFIDRKLVFRES